MPEGIRAQVQTLQALSVDYAAVGVTGHPLAGQTAQDLQAIADNVTELFERLAGKASEAQRRLAEIEYGDKLAKLTAAVDRKYLLDILTHPQLWDDPDERVSEVRDAVVAVSEQLVENIKQVNAQRALHFQVSLDSLIGQRKELRDWEKEFNRPPTTARVRPGESPLVWPRDQSPYPPPPYGGPPQVQPMSPDDEKLWATLIQLGGCSSASSPAHRVLRAQGPRSVRAAYAVTALNFQLTLLIAYVVGGS